MRPLALALLVVSVAGHFGLPINPELGVPGFPDCVRPVGATAASVEDAAMELVCSQRGTADQIKIGCVGDSITAGVHSTGGKHTYPGQLQEMLDAKYPGMYAVTNLGACGSTMLKHSNSPYWDRPQYKTLTANTWDILIIMLGTNDAKDPGSKGPDNWQHDCGGPDHTRIAGCSFAADYQAMIDVVSKLGTNASKPIIHSAIPPPLMEKDAIGANQTVINSVYPKLVPLINAAGKLPHDAIDVFTGMGGVADWQSKFPSDCTKQSPWAPCAWWCDDQSCDQCHPNNNGYTHMASVMMAGIGL